MAEVKTSANRSDLSSRERLSVRCGPRTRELAARSVGPAGASSAAASWKGFAHPDGSAVSWRRRNGGETLVGYFPELLGDAGIKSSDGPAVSPPGARSAPRWLHRASKSRRGSSLSDPSRLPRRDREGRRRCWCRPDPRTCPADVSKSALPFRSALRPLGPFACQHATAFGSTLEPGTGSHWSGARA